MLNVVLPCAGRGSRFVDAGYTFPKPLIDVNNEPMIKVVVDNLDLKEEGVRYIFLVLKEHYDSYSLKYLLPLITGNSQCEVIVVDSVTEGAACTVLLSKGLINTDDELLLANSDQWVNWDSDHFLTFMRDKNADGGILTFTSCHPKWSFAKMEEGTNLITEVAEKRPISNHATVGIYYFKHGSDFVKYAEQMIKRDIRTNGEFYVCPVFNEFIEGGKNIYNYPVAEMMGLGTPEDLQRFLNR
jgi:NDP-sugar pyrophosphorylase family protein